MTCGSVLDFEAPSSLTGEFSVLENLRLVAVAADEVRRVAGIVYENKRRAAAVVTATAQTMIAPVAWLTTMNTKLLGTPPKGLRIVL